MTMGVTPPHKFTIIAFLGMIVCQKVGPAMHPAWMKSSTFSAWTLCQTRLEPKSGPHIHGS